VNDISKESHEELREKKKMQRETCRKRACWLPAATMEEAEDDDDVERNFIAAGTRRNLLLLQAESLG
jgi:hypothetical protein